MILEAVTIAALGAAKAFGKGPLAEPLKRPANNNLVLEDHEHGQRCAFGWHATEKVSGDGQTKVKPLTLTLDFNPTAFRISRNPYFQVDATWGTHRVGETTDLANYIREPHVIDMEFMLDNTEVAPATTSTYSALGFGKLEYDESADEVSQRRVWHQMQLLNSMVEPIEKNDEGIARPEELLGGTKSLKEYDKTDKMDTWLTADDDVKTAAGDAMPQLVIGEETYPNRKRQPTGVWITWGPMEFLGTVRSLSMDIVVLDGNGNPRRTLVTLRVKGELFREEKFYAKYWDTPGGSAIEKDLAGAASARATAKQDAFLVNQRSERLAEAQRIGRAAAGKSAVPEWANESPQAKWQWRKREERMAEAQKIGSRAARGGSG